MPLIVRGRVLESAEAHEHVGSLCAPAKALHDLVELRSTEVYSYLDELAERLRFRNNRHLQQAFEFSRTTSRLSDAVLLRIYEGIASMFARAMVQHRVRVLLGEEWLDDWVDLPPAPGCSMSARVRAFGARTLHIVAGNAPAISAATILNNAITRGDAIIKAPSNDPMTASAIARTMIEMAPDHPLTRHVSVAYWKGGDTRVEHALYNPRHLDKIIAWGGTAAIRHVLRELPPGIDLITLNPKQSLALLSAGALRDSGALSVAAESLARDVAAMNQEGCFNPRLVYVAGDGRGDEYRLAVRLGELTFNNLQHLPEARGGPPRVFDPELKAELDALRLTDSEQLLFGGTSDEGAIVVSSNGRPVDFADRLTGRVANVLAVADLERALGAVSANAQTVAVFPHSLIGVVRDRLACHGAQRIVALGCAEMDPSLATPHDGLELLRRMMLWVTEERPSQRRP